MKKSIIVAVSSNHVIGNENDLIWHLPKDLAFFKKMTSGKYLLTGRKTFEALGKPLPNRTHLIVSSNFKYDHPSVKVFGSVEEAISFAKDLEAVDELFIAGGGTIYKYCLENQLVDIAYITRIHSDFNGDTFFHFNEENWNLISEINFDADQKNKFSMSFQRWEIKI